MKNTLTISDNRFVWADNLRVLATLCVIIVHVTSQPIIELGTRLDTTWWISNCYYSLVKICVPCFLMLSGVLLLNKEEELWHFLKRRYIRILLPFIFWSFIYISIELILKISKGSTLNFIYVINLILDRLIHGSCYHLWYIYVILGMYLFFPILGKWIRNSNEKEILYFLVIWFCTLFIAPIFPNFHSDFEIRYFTGFIGYPVLGYYLCNYVISQKINHINYWSVIMIILGAMTAIFGTYITSRNAGRYSGAFHSYLMPNIVFMAIGVFLLIKHNFRINNPLFSKTITFLSKYSFGIYLIHVLVLGILAKIGLTYNFIHPIIGTPITSLSCLFLSGFLIFLVHKLPYGKFISG